MKMKHTSISTIIVLIACILATTTLAAEAIPPGNAPGIRASGDPLESAQWDMALIHAAEARATTGGDKRVLVGVIDTGIDGTHPDIAPNFSKTLSRNFVTDIPELDGPCEVASCVDPVDVDGAGHGTHVAGTIAAAANGLGIVGVAPNVTLINLRAGQDSGYFFVQPVVDALHYAADIGVDVVNMSFYVDPWLFNCPTNSADSPAQQQQQQETIAKLTEALNYAHDHGVTLIAAAGNEGIDLGKPGTDTSSPNYPRGSNHSRTIDNATCLSLPAEGPHVISVSSVGPDRIKTSYSNYGTEQIELAAPGGNASQQLVLSSYPRDVLAEEGLIDGMGKPTSSDVVRSCKGSECGYYVYAQGTSMAAPHAVGVAALIISRYGQPDGNGGWGMNPDAVETMLYDTATDAACPANTAACQGNAAFNGFYGNGIVDAARAVTNTSTKYQQFVPVAER